MAFTIYHRGFDSSRPITIQIGGEDTGYPIENLEDRNYYTKWQNDNNNEEVEIDFDAGAAIAPDYFAIINHNLTDTNYGIKLEYGTGGVGGSFSSVGYLLGGAATYEDYAVGDSPIWLEIFTAPGSSYQYYRFTIEDKNGTKPNLAVVMLGVAQEFSGSYNWGASVGEAYGNERSRTPGGHYKVNQNWGPKNRFELDFDDFNETDKTAWQAVMDEVQGSLYPFVIKDIDDNLYYVRLIQDSMLFNLIEYQMYGNSIILEEEI